MLVYHRWKSIGNYDALKIKLIYTILITYQLKYFILRESNDNSSDDCLCDNYSCDNYLCDDYLCDDYPSKDYCRRGPPGKNEQNGQNGRDGKNGSSPKNAGVSGLNLMILVTRIIILFLFGST